MEKLLHERLRDHAEIGCLGFDGEGYSMSLWTREALALADEIERYYIPRPRFEDGEPVQFGDAFETSNGNEAIVGSIHITTAHAYLNSKGQSGKRPLGQPFKRPRPKVLDADGVEIKVGDMVWSVDESPEQFEVKEINAPMVALYQGSSFCRWTSGNHLTHNEPDTLEKLRDDMEYAIDAWVDGDEEFDWPSTKKWASRLTAIIERGA